ncbi:MAG: hypothetical protein JSV51_01610 [Candidatus Bathyarchaeota archaeon]|nr:MAG: hypothetical protein JSV51_01610 [Candidatus Bathyarchaeota archaeon]
MEITRQKFKAEALLIDLDGTLVDSIEAYSKAAETALSVIGCEKKFRV